jgi:DNA-binding NtrC family response regulator
MLRLRGLLRQAAERTNPLLVQGPAGSGKSLATMFVHHKSRRSNRPLIAIEATELEETNYQDLLESLLKHAWDTTVVIENVDQLAPRFQATMLEHMKQVGREEQDPNRPRIIATTRAQLSRLVFNGAFSASLLHRLNGLSPIEVPALREHPEDIVPIANSILHTLALHDGARQVAVLSPSAADLLASLPWPGNVGQLESVLRDACKRAHRDLIEPSHIVDPDGTGDNPALEPRRQSQPNDDEHVTEDMVRPLEEEEWRILTRALRATNGQVTRAAKLLQIGRTTLYRKIQDFQRQPASGGAHESEQALRALMERIHTERSKRRDGCMLGLDDHPAANGGDIPRPKSLGEQGSS